MSSGPLSHPAMGPRKRSLRTNVLLNSHLSIYNALTNPDLDDHELLKGVGATSRSTSQHHEPGLPNTKVAIKHVSGAEISATTSSNSPVTTTAACVGVDAGVDAVDDRMIQNTLSAPETPNPVSAADSDSASPSPSPRSFPISLDATPPPGMASTGAEHGLPSDALWHLIEESIKMKKVSSSILSSTTASDKEPLNRQLQKLTLYRHINSSPEYVSPDYAVNPLFASSMVMVELTFQNALSGIPASVSLHIPGTDQGVASKSTPLTPHVMVFETDEEDGNDGDDYDVEIVNPNGESGGGASTTTTFIMPKMLLSTNNSNESSNVNSSRVNSDGRFNVAVVSLNYLEETSQLVKSLGFLKKTNPRLNLFHINLFSWKHDDSLVRRANLVILINDGSVNFVHFLSQTFAPLLSSYQRRLPKLTIINMMSTNYFVNLLELIQLWKPYQMWKTASLNSDRIFECLQSYISKELSSNVNDSEDSWSFHGSNDNEAASSIICSSMVYSQSLQVSKTSPLFTKPNYKHLEHQMKSEMVSCSHYTDPLQLSCKLQLVYSLLNKLSLDCNSKSSPEMGLDPKKENDSNIWMVYSFTVGMGLGIGLATSAATLISYLLSDSTTTSGPAIPVSTTEKVLPVSDSSFAGMDIPVLREFIGFVTGSNWNYWFQMLATDLRVVSSLVMECVGGGIMKVCNLLLFF